MVDKDFDKISYEDPGGSKGTFHTFTFETNGAHAPYNEGYGQNLTTVRETEKEKVPLIGPRQTITIEQTKSSLPGTSGDPVKIAFTTLQTRKDQYGMIFAMRFPNDTDKALNSYSVFTSDGSVDTAHSIKSMGDLTVNGVTYTYYLAKINSDTQARTELTVQFNFVADQLMNGRMVLDIYEGFTFEHFSDSDYASADLTTHINFPHQKDFDKHKFQDVMSGDVLLAGTEQNDGTVKTDESLRLTDANLPKDVMSGDVFLVGTKQNNGTVLANGLLRLTGVNLRGAIPFTMTPILPYKGLATNAWSVVLTGINTGYPAPLFPSRGTGQISIRLLTHIFDDDSTIPTSNFTLQYRLIAYKESNAGLSRDYHLHTNISYTNDDGVRPVIKRSGRAFYLNRELTYTPPSDCFGYSLEFKQVKPTSPNLGNESILTCLLTQAM